MNQIDTTSAGNIIPLLTLQRGSESPVRYARHTDDITAGGEDYTSLPLMEIEIPKIHAGAQGDDEIHRVTMPIIGPVTNLGLGTSAKIYATIEEFDPTSPSSLRKLWYGRIIGSTTNPLGRNGFIELAIGGLKMNLSLPLALQCNATCAWGFGSDHCGIDREALAVSGTASIIEDGGLILAVSGVDYFTDPGRWYRGTVRRNGLGIPIRKIDNLLGRFTLDYPPPADWDGESVTVLPGCDKTLETCRERWDNESEFMGIAYACPSHHPLYETP